MPDASGRFRGISVPADAWERVFGEATCGRLLVGQGDDTYDPLCALRRGHGGLCAPVRVVSDPIEG